MRAEEKNRDGGRTAAVETGSLLDRLQKAEDLGRFLAENRDSLGAPSFPEQLDRLCRERGMVREHVICRAGIDRGFGHQLFRGDRKPSRDNVLRLAFGLGLDVEETQTLLRCARRAPLYPRIERDAAILFGLSHGSTILEMQGALSDLGLTILGGERYEHYER